MKPIALSEEIFCLPVQDRSTRLFEGLWPIEKEGITYNSYLIRDEKIVLIDSVQGTFPGGLPEGAAHAGRPGQDRLPGDQPHGARPFRRAARFPRRRRRRRSSWVRPRPSKCWMTFFGITENIRSVADGEELELGSHKLRFISAPMVHWPETMFTIRDHHADIVPLRRFRRLRHPGQGHLRRRL